jgi:hypothetical protein
MHLGYSKGNMRIFSINTVCGALVVRPGKGVNTLWSESSFSIPLNTAIFGW